MFDNIKQVDVITTNMGYTCSAFKHSTVHTIKIKDISNMGGFMDDKRYSGRSCGVCFRCGIGTNSSEFTKTVGFIKRIVGIVLFASLSWNAYAADGRFPGVVAQLDGLANAVGTPGNASAVVSPPEPGVAIGFETSARKGTGLDKKAANPELISLNVVDPVPVVHLGAVSLDVVDTGTSKQVQNPQTVAAAPSYVEAPVVPESRKYTNTLREVNELNTDAAPVVDQQVRNYKLMLPATDVAQKNVQPEELQGSTAGKEPVRLPFSVLLAILALISMIPVARRNG